ncbi:helix-turn-helix transcriptional regulator [Frigidibacter sp. MR17.24]|uniref:helix-turn-helix transcriptional regulator n=1 Tax=Frigidibacter sp. MR17.24 TaxID=3127345 RepID=UPI0030131BFF
MSAELISLVQAAALQPKGWEGVIGAIEGAGGGASGFAFVMDRGEPTAAFTGSFDPRYVQLYHEMHHLNPWAARFGALTDNRAVSARAVASDEVVTRSEFYVDWVLPQNDLLGGVAMKIGGRGQAQMILGVNIRRGLRDRFEPQLVGVLDRIGPHLRHALEINEALAERSARLIRAESGQRSHSWIIGLDRSARVTWVDPDLAPAVQRLFGIDRMGRIIFHDPCLSDWFAHRAVPVLGARAGEPAAPLEFRLRVQAMVLVLRLVPVAAHDMPMVPYRPGTFGDPGMALIISQVMDVPEARLGRGLGLTRAEAEVSLALAGGATPAEIARQRGASLHTVRNQLKIAMSKAGVGRAVDLVALVIRLTE